VPSWSFLTSHARVLTYIAQKPDSTGMEIAQAAGITERAARKIIAELQMARYVEAERIGRRNHYRVDTHQLIEHIGAHELTVGEFLALLQRQESADPPLSASAPPVGPSQTLS
jgi:hypothetical protein